jgi:KaiC/GvpD/RAD55 family RecA-like ATPase
VAARERKEVQVDLNHIYQQYQNIPEEVRQISNWVLWRSEVVNGRKTKIPYQPNGRKAKSNDSSTWSKFDEVVQASPEFDGIGWCVPLDGSTHYWGFDCDDAIDPANGQLKKWHSPTGHLAPVQPADILTLGSYAEVTPSGAGFRVFVKCDVPVPTGKKKEFGDRNPATGKVPGIEMYSSGRFFTFTGNRVEGTPSSIEERTQEALEFHRRLFPEKYGSSNATMPVSPTFVPAELQADEQIEQLASDLFDGLQGARYDLMFAISGVLVKLGWKRDRITLLLETLIALFHEADPAYNGVEELKKQFGILDDNYARAVNHQAIAGWSALEKCLKPDIFQTIRTSLKGKDARSRSPKFTADDALAMLKDQHLMNRKEPELVYLVEPEIIQGTVTCVTGKPACGKTTLIMKWCLDIATQRRIPILYLNRDNPEIVVHDRQNRFGGLPQNFYVWGPWNTTQNGDYCEPPDLNSDLLDEMVRKLGECVVVVDTFRAFAKGDENDNAAVAEFLKPLRRFSGYGATVLIIHHTDKEGKHWYRGASSIEGAVDVGLLITADHENGKIRKQFVTAPKSRMGDHVDVTYAMINDVPVRQTATVNDKLMAILHKHPQGISKEKFETECMEGGFRRQTVRDFIDNGCTAGLVSYDKKKLYPKTKKVDIFEDDDNNNDDRQHDERTDCALPIHAGQTEA